MPRKAKPLPSIAVLRALFELTPDGRLINRISRTARVAGAFADVHLRRGYRSVYAERLLFAHRVIWALSKNDAPPENIDHVNGDILDNRPSNLRAASHSENMFNRKTNKNSSSGVKGVHMRKDSGMWRAYISKDRKRIYLGHFPTKQEAAVAVAAARDELHGAFSRAA